MPELTLAQAQAAKEAIIARAVDGEKIDPAEYEAAEQAITRAKMAADLESARAKGAQQRAQQRQIDELRKQAAVLERNYSAGIDQLVALSETVDDKVADAQEALAAFFEQAKACQAAHAAATYFNSVSISYNHTHNDALRDLPPAEQPRVWNIPRDGFSYPRPTLEMAETYAPGTISQRRMVVHSLSPRVRMENKRPITRENAA